MAGLIEKIFQISFKILGFKIDISDFVGTIRNLCNWNSITKTTIWSLASSIHSVIVPIGLSLLTLFFLLDVTKKVMDYERFSWERMVFTFIRFLIFKMLIENSTIEELMEMLRKEFKQSKNVWKKRFEEELEEKKKMQEESRKELEEIRRKRELEKAKK